jgi:hypothetical protein
MQLNVYFFNIETGYKVLFNQVQLSTTIIIYKTFAFLKPADATCLML